MKNSKCSSYQHSQVHVIVRTGTKMSPLFVLIPGNAHSQNLQEGSSQADGHENCSYKTDNDLADGIENGCSGEEAESGFDETSQDWNEEIGSLTDDVLMSKEINVQCENSKIDDSENTDSANNKKNSESSKTHHPKHLHHHHLSWKNALRKAQSLPDPWEKFHIDDSCPTDVAIRHRYNALKKSWVKDEVRIKMELLVRFRFYFILIRPLHFIVTYFVHLY